MSLTSWFNELGGFSSLGETSLSFEPHSRMKAQESLPRDTDVLLRVYVRFLVLIVGGPSIVDLIRTTWSSASGVSPIRASMAAISLAWALVLW